MAKRSFRCPIGLVNAIKETCQSNVEIMSALCRDDLQSLASELWEIGIRPGPGPDERKKYKLILNDEDENEIKEVAKKLGVPADFLIITLLKRNLQPHKKNPFR